MSARGAAATVILTLWVLGLGLLVRREYFGDGDARLARAALLIGPGATFYTVEQDGRTVGYASSTLDTTATGLRLTDLLSFVPPGGGSRLTARSDVRLSRLIAPQSIEVELDTGPSPLLLRGAPDGDSLLLLTGRRGGEPVPPQRIRTRGPALPPSAIPLVVVARGQHRVGGRLAVTLFDVAAMETREEVLRVVAESLFTVSDSASLAGDRWVSAQQDTVRAWRVETEGAHTRTGGWVDAQGRFVELTLPGGLVLRRTTHEESAENWRRAGLGRSDGVP